MPPNSLGFASTRLFPVRGDIHDERGRRAGFVVPVRDGATDDSNNHWDAEECDVLTLLLVVHVRIHQRDLAIEAHVKILLSL